MNDYQLTLSSWNSQNSWSYITVICKGKASKTMQTEVLLANSLFSFQKKMQDIVSYT